MSSPPRRVRVLLLIFLCLLAACRAMGGQPAAPPPTPAAGTRVSLSPVSPTPIPIPSRTAISRDSPPAPSNTFACAVAQPQPTPIGAVPGPCGLTAQAILGTRTTASPTDPSPAISCVTDPPTPTPSGPVPRCGAVTGRATATPGSGDHVPRVPFAPADPHATNTPLPPSQPPRTVPATTPVAPGISAIPTRITPTDPATPAFTADDARAYVEAHPLGGKIGSHGPVTVTSVEFLTAHAVDARLQAHTNRPGDALVCLVQVRGQFSVSGPPSIDAAGTMTTHVTTETTAYQLFDAQTGELFEEIASG